MKVEILIFAEVEINDDETAEAYSQILKDMHGVSFHEINDAIKTKWSLSGLKYIKRKAWDIIGPAGHYVE